MAHGVADSVAAAADSETHSATHSVTRVHWAKRSARAMRKVAPFAFLILLLCSFRSSVADWNDVPTGSMKPSILEGDRIFVNKLAYDLRVPFTNLRLARWGEPARGDVVVFYAPHDNTRMVKRVVGVPGDTISMVDNRLFVNGEPAHYETLDPRVQAQIPARERPSYRFFAENLGGADDGHPVMSTPALFGGSRHSFEPLTVPAGKYFLMGDNRDNSHDSRYYGLVDRDRIVGRASAVALSLDPEHSYKPRWDRFFSDLP